MDSLRGRGRDEEKREREIAFQFSKLLPAVGHST